METLVGIKDQVTAMTREVGNGQEEKYEGTKSG